MLCRGVESMIHKEIFMGRFRNHQLIYKARSLFSQLIKQYCLPHYRLLKHWREQKTCAFGIVMASTSSDMASASGSTTQLQMGREPYFIQVVRTPSKNTDSLVIPPPFVEEFMNGDRCRKGKIKLDGCPILQWVVEINTDGTGVELGDGWAQFVAENITEGWMLVMLRYEGAMIFSARRYGPSGALMVGTPMGTIGKKISASGGGVFPSFARLVIPEGVNSQELDIPAGILRGTAGRNRIDSKIWVHNMNWGMSCNARINLSEEGGVIKGGWEMFVRSNISWASKWCIVDFDRFKQEVRVMAFVQCGGVMASRAMMNVQTITDRLYVDSAEEEYPDANDNDDGDDTVYVISDDSSDDEQDAELQQNPIPSVVVRVAEKYAQLPTGYAKKYFKGVRSRRCVVKIGDGQSWDVSFQKSNDTYRFSGRFVELRRGYGLTVGNKCKVSYLGGWVFVMESL